MSKVCFGVDIGGTTVKLGMFDEEGTLKYKCEIPTRKEEDGKMIIPDICDKITEILTINEISKSDITGVGLGIPGAVADDGTVLKCVNLGWGIFNVGEKFKEIFGEVNVKCGNDANVAALGEMFKGSAEGEKNMVMITLGTGVGGGVIIGGKIITGVNGAAGEIGHMPMSDDEEGTCGCGKKGCLEQYASATGVVKVTKKILNSTDKASKIREIENFTAKDVFDMAKSGDEIANLAVDELGKYLGKAAAHISCVVNPGVFVIGGGVSKAGQFLIDRIEKYYKEYAFFASRDTKFILASLGNDAGIYGAAALILS
ncbi:MAG: ROK family glucokinase [Lachnospiraceae bacterium]|nr:ROK family glucokinase [Lachnospiraceae bacterium]MDE6699320.1 ROK family glucokinase [Lachnospiraceae bacterium]